MDPSNFRNFERMLEAHKIEMYRQLAGKMKYVEFTLAVDEKIELERLNDIDRLKRFTFTLTQADPVWYPDFENDKVDFTD